MESFPAPLELSHVGGRLPSFHADWCIVGSRLLSVVGLGLHFSACFGTKRNPVSIGARMFHTIDWMERQPPSNSQLKPVVYTGGGDRACSPPPLSFGSYLLRNFQKNCQKEHIFRLAPKKRDYYMNSSPLCHSCGGKPHTTVHVCSCPSHPTPLTERDLWERLRLTSALLFGLPFFDLPPLPPLPLNPLLLTGMRIRGNHLHH